MKLCTKRVYDPSVPSDGRRILIDRLWPRGLAKARAHVDHWARSVAPSDGLRRWYGHDPSRWDEFRRRYREELDANADAVADLRSRLGPGTNTLLFAAREPVRNNATVLRHYLARGGSDRRASRKPS